MCQRLIEPIAVATEQLLDLEDADLLQGGRMPARCWLTARLDLAGASSGFQDAGGKVSRRHEPGGGPA